jgi:hypothetical protein
MHDLDTLVPANLPTTNPHIHHRTTPPNHLCTYTSPHRNCCRDEGSDILILARSDARQAESLEEALWRAAAFADAGADILFIDALASVEEMRAFTSLGGAAAKLPKVCAALYLSECTSFDSLSSACKHSSVLCRAYQQAMLTPVCSQLLWLSEGQRHRIFTYQIKGQHVTGQEPGPPLVCSTHPHPSLHPPRWPTCWRVAAKPRSCPPRSCRR